MGATSTIGGVLFVYVCAPHRCCNGCCHLHILRETVQEECCHVVEEDLFLFYSSTSSNRTDCLRGCRQDRTAFLFSVDLENLMKNIVGLVTNHAIDM